MKRMFLTAWTTAFLLAPVSESGVRAKTDAPAELFIGDQGGRGSRGAREAAQAPQFTERDQELIRRYFRMNTENLPPGLAKRGGNLPPGLERHLQRNGTLPPGLQKRVQPFPEDLRRRLPRLPAGYSRVILGVRVLIVDRAYKIFDVMVIRP